MVSVASVNLMLLFCRQQGKFPAANPQTGFLGRRQHHPKPPRQADKSNCAPHSVVTSSYINKIPCNPRHPRNQHRKHQHCQMQATLKPPVSDVLPKPIHAQILPQLNTEMISCGQQARSAKSTFTRLCEHLRLPRQLRLLLLWCKYKHCKCVMPPHANTILQTALPAKEILLKRCSNAASERPGSQACDRCRPK